MRQSITVNQDEIEFNEQDRAVFLTNTANNFIKDSLNDFDVFIVENPENPVEDYYIVKDFVEFNEKEQAVIIDKDGNNFISQVVSNVGALKVMVPDTAFINIYQCEVTNKDCDTNVSCED